MILGANLSPGITDLLAADLLATHPYADQLEISSLSRDKVDYSVAIYERGWQIGQVIHFDQIAGPLARAGISILQAPPSLAPAS